MWFTQIFYEPSQTMDNTDTELERSDEPIRDSI